jgi:adenylyltransferase/sulfurtransferase
MNEITVSELKKMRDEGAQHQLIDVREVHEYEISNIGGEHIPMSLIPLNIDKIRRDIPVVLQCRSGGRSGQITRFLEAQGFTNVANLQGGILAWARDIEPGMQVG